MKRFLILAALLLLIQGLPEARSGQDKSAEEPHRRSGQATTASTSSRILNLERAIEKQQLEMEGEAEQIRQLRQELQSRDQAMQEIQQRLEQALSNPLLRTVAEDKANTASAQAQFQEGINTVRADVAKLKENSVSTALTLEKAESSISELENPAALHFRGITITPGALIAAQTVYRSRALAGEVTPFNAVPLPGAPQSKLSEFFGSGRQSRLSLLAEGEVKEVKLTSYIEGDFLSSGITSNNNESNSYTLRQRQAWAQASFGGWSLTGGQMWSLVTETRKGLDNRTEAVPMTIDQQFVVGFSWARQYGFRVVKNFRDKVWLGFAAENAQTLLTAHGSADNFLIGSPGSSGSTYNPSALYSFNKLPDFIVKAAFEPGIGHYEVFGIIRDFRDRVYPCATTSATGTCLTISGPSAAGVFNNSATGAGFGANARITLKKQFDFGLHFLGGDGVGRYGTSTLPDTTVRPDGVLALLRGYQGLITLEWHKPRFDVYINGGAEYASRDWGLNASGKPVGYGSPLFSNTGCDKETPPGTPVGGQFPPASAGFLPGGLTSCTGDTRNLIDGTLGFWYRIYDGPKGRLQVGPQYSYVVRNTWSGSGGDPHGIDNMLFTSFRYYLPGSAPTIAH
jgi:hypothetical protein